MLLKIQNLRQQIAVVASITSFLIIAGCAADINNHNAFLNSYMSQPNVANFLNANAGAKCGTFFPLSKVSAFESSSTVLFSKHGFKQATVGCWADDATFKSHQKQCADYFGETCGLGFVKTRGLTNTANDYYKNLVAQKNSQLRENRRQAELAEMRARCVGFGYQLNSNGHKACMLELHKIKNQKAQAATVDPGSTALIAIIEEERRQRNFDRSMKMMQRGIDIMNGK